MGEIDGWSVVRFLHVVGAIVWVGGQLTLTLVVGPPVRAALDPAARRELMSVVGRRFALLANAVVLPVQLATGLALAWRRSTDGLDAFSSGSYGSTLSLKVGLVFVMLGLAAAHGVLAAQDRLEASRWLSWAALGVSLWVVLLATSLAP